jgi:hypothetical protein
MFVTLKKIDKSEILAENPKLPTSVPFATSKKKLDRAFA